MAVARDQIAADRAAIPPQGGRGALGRTRAEMNRRFGFGFFTLLMVMLFVGLGFWQLQRRAEKHTLIAALTLRLAAASEPLPGPSQWAALAAAGDEFHRVSFTAT